MKTYNFIRDYLRIYQVSKLNYSQWLKPYVEFHTLKHKRSRENSDKGRKALLILMNNIVYRKSMKKMRKKINVKLVSDKRYQMQFIIFCRLINIITVNKFY